MVVTWLEADYPVYKCLDCEEEFDDPEWREEHEDHPEVEGPYREVWHIPSCPYCGSDYIEGGYPCKWCEERWASGDYCETCLEDIGATIEAYGRRKGRNYGETVELVDAWLRK